MSAIYKKLEEVCEILDSRRVPITAKNRKTGIYPYYGANGLQDYVAEYIFDDELVLLAEDGGNFGSKERPIAYRVSGKCWVNNHAHVLKAKPLVNADYLCYALMFYDTEGLVNGATRQKLTQTAMRQMMIPYRNMTEQLQIADEINQVIRLIDKRKEELSLLDQLVKSRFIELFGDMYLNSLEWTEVSLESISDIVSGITKGRKIKTAELREVPYMAVSNVKNGYIDWTTVKTIEVTEQELNQYRLLPDDVLMTEGGDPDKVGRGAIIREPLENCIHQNHIFRVRFNERDILPVFFAEYLQHQRAKRYFLGCAKQTTGIASINMKQLRNLPVLMPPLELQRQFAVFVTQTDKSKLEVEKSLKQLEILKKSLMQQYFG